METLPIINKKILEVCPFSNGVCGVWSRVKQESEYLVKAGYDVLIFSSNFTKGSKELAKDKDTLSISNDPKENINIIRFPTTMLGGESFMSWFTGDALSEAIKFQPDVIIVHNYRHLHTTAALGLAQQLKKNGKDCKVFLVTHAPFIEGNTTRGIIASMVVNLYDKLIGPRTINKFDRVITISKWEEKFLDQLNLNKEKIARIPNGLPAEFFNQPFAEEINNTVLFLGRVAPIKKIETLLQAAKILPEIQFSIVGPIDETYVKELNSKFIDFPKNVTFYGAVNDMKKKIEIIDHHKIFILPSLREAMPQVIIEAMARGKIIIASDNEGSAELIENEKDGFLFEIDNADQLACLIKSNMNNQEYIGLNALAKAKKYYWGDLIGKYIQLIEE